MYNYDCVYALGAGGGLQFSVDLSDDDGTLHTLVLNVQARYGNGLASLRYTFNFQRQVQQQHCESYTTRSQYISQLYIAPI